MNATMGVRQMMARQSDKGHVMLTKMLARRAASRAMRIKTNAQNEELTSRMEQMGQALRVRDDTLWNPFEVIATIFLIIFAFGFLLGRSHYLFVVELFSPVIVIGALILVFQTAKRWRGGSFGLLVWSLFRGRRRSRRRSERAQH